MQAQLKIFLSCSLWLFCQTVSAANPPTTISPGTSSSPGTLVGLLTPTFSWSPVSGATGYGLYIRDLTAPGSPLIYPNASGITANPLTGSSFTLPNGYLANGHFYRWNMTSFAGSTESSTASSVLYFQTPAVTASPPTITSSGGGNSSGTVAVTPPTINAPGSASSPGTVLGSLTPTFSWNWVSGTTGYGLYIRDMTASGTPLIYPNSNGTTYSPLTGTSFTLPNGYLVNGHTYRWNMTSFSGSTESSAASGVLYFQTPTIAVSAPVINSPSSGSSAGTVAVPPPTINAPGSASSPGTTVSSLTPEFRWNGVNGANGYGLYIRDMTAAGTPLIYPNANGVTANPITGMDMGLGPFFTLPAGHLVNGHIYRWNMTSFSGTTESSAASGVLYFQTPAVTASPPTITSSGSESSVGTVAASPTPTVAPSIGDSTGTTVSSPTQTSSGNIYPNDYPNKLALYCSNATPNSECPENTKDDWGFFNRECTSYVAWRMNRDARTTGRPYFFSNSMRGGQWGDAGNWDSNAAKVGFLVDNHPAVGAIAQWEAADLKSGHGGHVAYVEAVNADGSVNVSEFNYHLDHNFDIRSKENGYDVRPPRFIHITFSNVSVPLTKITTISSPSSGGTVSDVAKPVVTSSPQIAASAVAPNQTPNSPAIQSVAAKSIVAPASKPVTYATLTVRARPNEGGTVSGGGTYALGSSQTVTATPNNGFIFERWTEERWTEEGRTVSSSANYNFTLNGNRNLVAHFRPRFMNHPFTPNSPPNR